MCFDFYAAPKAAPEFSHGDQSGRDIYQWIKHVLATITTDLVECKNPYRVEGVPRIINAVEEVTN